MHNSVLYMKTSLCANVQLNSTNFDFNLKSSLTRFFHRALQIMDLLNLCLQYNGKHHKQLRGTAIVSVVVAEIITQNFEERTLATYKQTLPLWLLCCRYLYSCTQSRNWQFSRTLQQTKCRNSFYKGDRKNC